MTLEEEFEYYRVRNSIKKPENSSVDDQKLRESIRRFVQNEISRQQRTGGLLDPNE